MKCTNAIVRVVGAFHAPYGTDILPLASPTFENGGYPV